MSATRFDGRKQRSGQHCLPFAHPSSRMHALSNRIKQISVKAESFRILFNIIIKITGEPVHTVSIRFELCLIVLAFAFRADIPTFWSGRFSCFVCTDRCNVRCRNYKFQSLYSTYQTYSFSKKEKNE